jgi:hypothetical protein
MDQVKDLKSQGNIYFQEVSVKKKRKELLRNTIALLYFIRSTALVVR